MLYCSGAGGVLMVTVLACAALFGLLAATILFAVRRRRQSQYMVSSYDM